MATERMGTKRQRAVTPGPTDLLFKARIIMHDDPFKERAPIGEDTKFRALFGCSHEIALMLWRMLLESKLVPKGGTITHFLWTLLFLKVYPTEENMKLLTRGADQKTIRKWVPQFIESISATCDSLVCHCCSFSLLIVCFFMLFNHLTASRCSLLADFVAKPV